MNFNIVTTPPFEKELKSLIKKYPSVKKDKTVQELSHLFK